MNNRILNALLFVLCSQRASNVVILAAGGHVMARTPQVASQLGLAQALSKSPSTFKVAVLPPGVSWG